MMMIHLVIHADPDWEVDHIVVRISKCLKRGVVVEAVFIF